MKNPPPLPGVSGISVELKIFTLELSLEIADFPEKLGFSKPMCCEAYHDIHNIHQIENFFLVSKNMFFQIKEEKTVTVRIFKK